MIPATNTWADLFGLILRDSGVTGVGQEAQAQDVTDLQARVWMLIQQWKRRRWLVYHLVDLFIVCDGSESYTIGKACQIDTVRPDMIEAAYARQITQPAAQRIDFPMRIIPSREDYSLIAQKRLQGGPSYYLFYDSGYPEGRLYPYPLMNSQYELHILMKADLDSPGKLSDTILLPPEYMLAIYWCGQQLARSGAGLPPKKEVDGGAKAALNTLRHSNFQISTLTLPGGLGRGGSYNPWSDTVGPSYR